jgi:hypothetical protein
LTKISDIDRLVAALEALRIEFERFFNGALAVAPLELRDQFARQLRLVRERPGLSAVDRFRLGQLEARFNTFGEISNRRLRDREEGRGREARIVNLPPPEPKHFDPATGIVLGDQPSSEAVEALYRAVARSQGAVQFDLGSFRRYLTKQADAIREKTGCREVQFRLVEEEGQTKLRARPVRAV